MIPMGGTTVSRVLIANRGEVWDRRLPIAARAEGLGLFPENLEERA